MSTRKQQGFTIIEVVLVLAIAGLIFLMVFIALPALQRGQRDSQRRADLGRLQAAVNSYQTNNKGTLPDFGTAASVTTFISSYLTTNGDTFSDPNGTAYALGTGSYPATFEATNPYIRATIGSVCSQTEGTLTAGQGARKVAFQMKLEGSGVTCVSN